MSIKDDWRYMHQDRFLKDLVFSYQKYPTSLDHDHCCFCSIKFSAIHPDCVLEGWTDESQYRWICDACFQDFKTELHLSEKSSE